MSVQDYLGVLAKRHRLILAFLVVVTAVVGAATAVQRPVYRASARVIVEGNRTDPLRTDVQQPDMNNFYDTQYTLIRSRPVMERAIEQLQLAKRRPRLASSADPAGALLGAVSVEPVPRTRLVDINVEDGDPVFAADLANAIAGGFVRYTGDVRQQGIRDAYAFLTSELRNMKQKVNESQLALGQYKADTGLIPVVQRQNIAATKMGDFHAAYVEAQTKRLEMEAQLKLLKDSSRNPEALEAKSEALGALRAQEAAAETEVNNLLRTYKDKHPSVIRARAQLDDIRARLKEETSRIIQALEGQYLIQKAREAAMLQAFERYKAEAQDLGKKEVKYDILQREASANEDLFSVLARRLRETDLSGQLNTNSAQVVESALVPKFPVRPKPLLNMLMGILAGLAGGVVAALLLEFSSDAVQKPEEVGQLLEAPLLGTVPVLPAARSDKTGDKPRYRLVATDDTGSPAAEAFNIISVAVRNAANGSPPGRILITSAVPQEGKSTLAANLGSALARSGSRVLLVDSDLRHPSLDKFFGIRPTSGIGPVLSRGAPLEEAVYPTPIEGLFLLPAGPASGNSLALIKSEQFRVHVDALSGRFDVILFDSPPITLVADAMALAPLSDAIVLAVRNGHCSRWRLRKMLAQLDRLRVPVLGFVYGGYAPRDDRYYSYYYGSPPAKGSGRPKAEKQAVGRSS